MNIVHIEDFFHPDAGYQVNQLSRLQAAQGHTVTVVTSEFKKMPGILTSFFGRENIAERDNRFFDLTGVKIIRLPLITYYSGRSVYRLNIFKTVDTLKPDVILVHGSDTLIGIQYILRAPRLNYPIVLDNHMLEMASVNPFNKVFRHLYKRFITPKIIKNKIPLIRVVDSNYLEKCLGFPIYKTVLLSLGTNTEYFKPDIEKAVGFRRQYGIDKDDLIALYAGKLDEAKGGLFLAETIQGMFCANNRRKVTFVIIGNIVGEYGKQVEQILNNSENRIIRFQTQSYLDLASFYQAADIAVFPKQCSLSFFDVQSCGLPVIFEQNEINNGRALFGNAMTFIPGDTQDFRRKIIECAEMDKSQYDKMKWSSRKYIMDHFDYVPIAQEFTNIMANEVERYKKKSHKIEHV